MIYRKYLYSCGFDFKLKQDYRYLMVFEKAHVDYTVN